MTAHDCTEPHGEPACLVCHTDNDDGTNGRPATTFVLADTYTAAREWCRREGVRLYARSTVIACRGPAVRGYRVRDEDRVVVLGRGPSDEVLDDMRIAAFETSNPPTWEYL